MVTNLQSTKPPKLRYAEYNELCLQSKQPTHTKI